MRGARVDDVHDAHARGVRARVHAHDFREGIHAHLAHDVHVPEHVSDSGRVRADVQTCEPAGGLCLQARPASRHWHQSWHQYYGYRV